MHPMVSTEADIYLEFPSVGATENLLLAAALASGVTTIGNAAREPELSDLAEYLNKMGAKIEGAGTSTIVIHGVPQLTPATHRVVPDRLEAGTFAVAGAMTGGTVRVVDCVPEHLRMELRKMTVAGCTVTTGPDWIQVVGPDRPVAVNFATLPFPRFPHGHAPSNGCAALGGGRNIDRHRERVRRPIPLHR